MKKQKLWALEGLEWGPLNRMLAHHAPTLVCSPALHKLGMVVHTSKSSLREIEEDQEFKVLLGYKLSLRSSWATCDLVSKKKQGKRSQQNMSVDTEVPAFKHDRLSLSPVTHIKEITSSWKSSSDLHMVTCTCMHAYIHTYINVIKILRQKV